MSNLKEKVEAKRKKEKAEETERVAAAAANQTAKDRHDRKKQKELLDLLMDELNGQFGFTVTPVESTLWGEVAQIKYKNYTTFCAISREVSHTYRPSDECGEETYTTDAWFISDVVNPTRHESYQVYEEEGLMATTNTGKTHKERFLENLVEWVHEYTKWHR